MSGFLCDCGCPEWKDSGVISVSPFPSSGLALSRFLCDMFMGWKIIRLWRLLIIGTKVET